VAVRIANTARNLDPEVAARAARIALEARDLDPRERANLEGIAASAVAADAATPRRGPAPIDIGAPARPAVPPAPAEARETESWSLGEEEEPAKPFDYGHSAIDLGDGGGEDAPLELDSSRIAKPERPVQRTLHDASAIDLESGDEGGAGFLRTPDPDEKPEG
jgi:hypothetical protein